VLLSLCSFQSGFLKRPSGTGPILANKSHDHLLALFCNMAHIQQ
jgi:hypothetical protein